MILLCAIQPMASASPPHHRKTSMHVVRLAGIVMALLLWVTPAFAQGKSAPDDAYLYFIWPQDGTAIKGGFWCRFGLRNMGVTHAGDDFANSGHHHLLIDV